MDILVKILTPTADIVKGIEKAILSKMNNALQGSVNGIKSKLANIIESGIVSTPEYADIMNGTLKGELGLIAPATRLKSIIDRVKDTVEVTQDQFRFSGGKIVGGLTVGILINDAEYSDLTSIDAASYKSHEFTIEWLKWMLVSGYAVISGWHITSDLTPEQVLKSRSHKAIMIEGGDWTLISSRIPPQFAGVVGNNFMSRGLETKKDEIVQVIQQEFINHI